MIDGEKILLFGSHKQEFSKLCMHAECGFHGDNGN